MKLSKETVELSLKEFVDALGAPQHVKTIKDMDKVINLYHRELSKYHSEETFPAALSIAWQQARRFPCIADFHRGFDAPVNHGPTMADIGL